MAFAAGGRERGCGRLPRRAEPDRTQPGARARGWRENIPRATGRAFALAPAEAQRAMSLRHTAAMAMADMGSISPQEKCSQASRGSPTQSPSHPRRPGRRGGLGPGPAPHPRVQRRPSLIKPLGRPQPARSTRFAAPVRHLFFSAVCCRTESWPARSPPRPAHRGGPRRLAQSR